ncbi:formin-like protein 7 [Zingiber officinale]|uniref:formin-like protein 7 n=1 Tax=Zingiber officinale TaxID=94328 RepID=UPI001C4D55E5|nr:formin-like protein 7 [Zingiber officinale]
MANQPVGRPWFLRLASQARIDPPAPPAQPQPAQPPPASPVRQASLAFGRTSLLPAQAPPPPPPSPVPTQPQETPQPTQTTNAAAPSPPEVPKPATTPMLQRVASPRPVTVAPVANPSPPSRADAANFSPPEVPRSAPTATPMLQRLPSPIPVTATTRSPPPPQSPKVINSSSASLIPHPEPDPIAESQPKQTIEQNSSNKNPDKKIPFFPTKAEGKNSATANENRSTTKSKDQGETRAITIAGQNMGAFLDLSPSYGLQHQIRKQQVRPTVGDTWFKDLNNGAHKEGKPAKESNSNDNKNKQQQKPMISLVNSNVQSVNNSLMLNASCDQGSPGVHIKLTRKRSGKNDQPSLH